MLLLHVIAICAYVYNDDLTVTDFSVTGLNFMAGFTAFLCFQTGAIDVHYDMLSLVYLLI